MSAMTDVSVGPNSFVEVASGTARAFIQLQTRGSCIIFVGQTAPADGDLVGIRLETGEAEEVSFDQLEANDVVYAKAMGGNVKLLAMTADAAPSP